MRRVLAVILEQARKARERATFYRKLAHVLEGTRTAPDLEKSARDLEARAFAMEQYAKHDFGDSDEGEPENGVSDMREAVSLEFLPCLDPEPQRDV